MAGKDKRAERLKAQLRANLKRRKAPQLQPQADAPPEPDQRRTAIDPMSTAADAAD